jgi:glycosyltransferase involved in cell wall biosynthesis
MRIGLAARGLSIESGGVHRFIKSLIFALARQAAPDQVFIFYNQEKFKGLAPTCSEIVIRHNNRVLWDFVLLPRMLKRLKIDAVILPKNIVPFFVGCRPYVVIHDLAYFDRELNAYPLLDTIYMRALVPGSVRRAAGVFAVSQSTKQDIVRRMWCEPDKITVTQEAAAAIYRPINDSIHLQQVRKKYGLPDRFIMYAGSLSPRKNIIRLLEAFANIADRIPHYLVLTGSGSWKDSSVYKTMRRLGLVGRIRQLGYVEHEDMPALYNLACTFVYPSLYEGFGLPVLEAMQCGCPVVASNTTSIPEVAGDAGVLVDPLDVKALAQAIYQTVTDEERRRRLIASGLQQAKKFSWDRCAKTMLETIRGSDKES